MLAARQALATTAVRSDHSYRPAPDEERRVRAAHAAAMRRTVSTTVATYLVVLVLGAVLVGRDAAITQLGYQLDALNRQAATLRVQREDLQMQVAASRAPEQVASTAQTQLGMQRPTQYATVVVSAPPTVAEQPTRAETVALEKSSQVTAAVRPPSSLLGQMAQVLYRWLVGREDGLDQLAARR